MERFKRLSDVEKNLYQDGSPIIIEAGALLLDTKLEQVLVQLKFHNISEKNIKALQIDIENYDIGGQRLDSINGFQYLDLSVKKGETFGTKVPIKVPDKKTRIFQIRKIIVFFEKNEKWMSSSSTWHSLPEKEVLIGDNDFCQQYKIEFGDTANYRYKEINDLWQCVCGEYNMEYSVRCSSCNTEKEMIIQTTDDVINEHLCKRLAKEKAEKEQKKKKEESEKRKLEEEKEFLTNRRKKKILVSVVSCFVTIILINGILFLNKKFSIEKTISSAKELAVQNDYVEAVKLLENAKYQDSTINQMKEEYIHDGFDSILQSNLILAKEWHSKYKNRFDDRDLLKNAQMLFCEQRYEESFRIYSILSEKIVPMLNIDHFLIINANKNSDEQIGEDNVNQWLYASAVALYEENPSDQAFELEKIFSFLDNYEDSRLYKKMCKIGSIGNNSGICEKLITVDEPELVWKVCTKDWLCEVMENVSVNASGFIEVHMDKKILGLKADYVDLFFDSTNKLERISVRYNSKNLSKRRFLKILKQKLEKKESVWKQDKKVLKLYTSYTMNIDKKYVAYCADSKWRGFELEVSLF